jgi:hypothetical protein
MDKRASAAAAAAKRSRMEAFVGNVLVLVFICMSSAAATAAISPELK